MDNEVRDTLAFLDDLRVALVAAVWSAADDMQGRLSVDGAVGIAFELRALARRAAIASQHRYCYLAV